MKIISNLYRFIQRKRHAAGFSVHSPFAFDLIKDVIHTPHSYYIYYHNKKLISLSNLEKETNFKHAELLFRLTNRFNSQNILEIGSGIGINTLYLASHSKQTAIYCVETDNKKIQEAKSLLSTVSNRIDFSTTIPINNNCFDTIIWNLKNYTETSNVTLDKIYNNIKTDGFIVVESINSNRQNREVWQKIVELDSITMSFDLGGIGIGFYKPSLPKLNYDVYF